MDKIGQNWTKGQNRHFSVANIRQVNGSEFEKFDFANVRRATCHHHNGLAKMRGATCRDQTLPTIALMT